MRPRGWSGGVRLLFVLSRKTASAGLCQTRQLLLTEQLASLTTLLEVSAVD